MSEKPFYRPWRTSRELAGVRARAVSLLRSSLDGATVEVDLKTLENLIEIVEQAMQTERGHEAPEDRAGDARATIPFLTKADLKVLEPRNRPKRARLL